MTVCDGSDEPAHAEPTLADVIAIVHELVGEVEVLADKVDDLESIVWHLELEDRKPKE
jgi:hypothetical protein